MRQNKRPKRKSQTGPKPPVHAASVAESSAVQPAASQPHETARLHIDDMSLRRATYSEVGVADQGFLAEINGPIQLNINVTLSGGIRVADPYRAVVTLDFECTGDSRVQPVSVSGQFTFAIRRENEYPLVSFVQFLSRNVAVLAVPYIRELVANLTTRGAYGTVTISPLVAQPFLTPEQERETTEQIETALRTRNDITAAHA